MEAFLRYISRTWPNEVFDALELGIVLWTIWAAGVVFDLGVVRSAAWRLGEALLVLGTLAGLGQLVWVYHWSQPDGSLSEWAASIPDPLSEWAARIPDPLLVLVAAALTTLLGLGVVELATTRRSSARTPDS